MISIAILDDERTAIEETRKCLETYFKEIGEDATINEFEDAKAFINGYSPRFDLLFLDIQMAKENGIDIAKKIRETDSTSIIVFVTNMANLAVKGYEVDASDFIVKPLEYFSFKIKMNRIMERVRQNPKSVQHSFKRKMAKSRSKPHQLDTSKCLSITLFIILPMEIIKLMALFLRLRKN